MIKVGQKVKFDSMAHILEATIRDMHHETIGTVIEVHKDHRWFLVEYLQGNELIKMCFRFDDIGDTVELCQEDT